MNYCPSIIADQEPRGLDSHVVNPFLIMFILRSVYLLIFKRVKMHEWAGLLYVIGVRLTAWKGDPNFKHLSIVIFAVK